MVKALPWVLVLSFSLSTLVLDCADYDPCNRCADHIAFAGGGADPADDACGSPGNPCHQHPARHCCCAHSQSILPTDGPERTSPGITSRLDIPSERARLNPVPRQAFHVPIA